MSMKRPLDNEDDQGGVKKRLEAGEVVFSGRIESMDPVTRASLIHCHEIARQSCKALKASNQLVLSSMAGVGDSVAFFLRWSREGPQASPPMVRLRCGDDNFALLGKFRTGTAGYGFVSCDLMTEFFGRDAHVERDLAQTFETGQTVCFNVSITQGMPMVTEMSACLPDWHPTPSDVPLEIETAESVEPLQALDPEEPQQCHEPSPSDPSEAQLAAPPEPSTGDEGWEGNQWNPWNQGRDDWKKWSDWKDRSPDWSSWSSDWSWHAEGAGQGERLGKKATGVIKSFNERTNYGFIECKELADIYGRDTFVHGKEFQGHYVGEKVNFTVYLGPRGQPQAFNVENAKLREKKHWDKPKASGAKRKDRSERGEEKTQKTKNSFLLGIVTSYFPERGCGFIECDEVRRKYGQEVYVFKDVLADSLAGPGDLVAFYLHLSKQKKAQASHPMLRLKTGTEGTFALKGRFEAVAKGVTEIHCPETLNFFGSPVRVNQRLGSKLEAGSAVSFNVTVSDQGYPLAYNAEPCDDQWLPTATQLTLATATTWDAWKTKESGNGYSGYGGSSPAPRTAVLIGRIKSFDRDNYGLIESELVSSACGCDAMVTDEDLSDFEVGETVLFEVSFAHSRQPQARYVRRCAI